VTFILLSDDNHRRGTPYLQVVGQEGGQHPTSSRRKHRGARENVIGRGRSAAGCESGLWRVWFGHGHDRGASAIDCACLRHIFNTVDRLDVRQPAECRDLRVPRWIHAILVFARVQGAVRHYTIGQGAGDRLGQWV